jgi:Zn finger protein HypA/HybF involved in hydrogenase expression
MAKDSRSYFDLLRDPQWQKKRLEVMQRATFKCEQCEDGKSTLNVHHSYYEKGLMPWEYPDESLHCLCEPCHQEAERIRKGLMRQLGRISLGDTERLLGFAKGLEMAEFPNTTHKADDYESVSGMVQAFGFYLPGGQLNRVVDLLIKKLIASDGEVDGYVICDAFQGAAPKREVPIGG